MSGGTYRSLFVLLQVKPQVKSRLATLQQLLPRLPEKVLAACGTGGPIDPLLNPPSAGVPNPVGAPPTTPNQPTIKLPTVDEAWDLPIPAELTQRQVQLRLQEADRTKCSTFTGSGAQWSAFLAAERMSGTTEEEEEEVEQETNSIHIKEEQEDLIDARGDITKNDG